MVSTSWVEERKHLGALVLGDFPLNLALFFCIFRFNNPNAFISGAGG